MTSPTTHKIEEFRINIPQADLDDLADRLGPDPVASEPAGDRVGPWRARRLPA